MLAEMPDIPKVYEGMFPPDYQNKVAYWGFFSRKDIEGNIGNLLMLDIDFGRKCSLACPTCFRRLSFVDDTGEPDLTYDELVSIIEDAAKLYPLQSVKICGAGEPLEDPEFLRFVKEMDAMNIGVNAFIKGHVIGSDEWTSRVFGGEYGIHHAEELCEELAKYKLSLNLCCQSFKPDVQDAMVGGQGYSGLRNQAMINLAKAGFNKSNPTRLCLCNAPVTKLNYDEAFDIYVYARERNMYPVIAVSMTSGKQLTPDFIEKIDLSYEQKLGLWVRTYEWNIKHGIQTMEQLRGEGISALPGGHPCNQNAVGIYITANGNVVGCPGFSTPEGNVRKENIKDIWERSQNRRKAGTFNCGCPPKEGTTIPVTLYGDVMERLEKKFLFPSTSSGSSLCSRRSGHALSC